MKNFTKEYIKEAMAKEIQGLRKNKNPGITTLSLECGDWILNGVRDKNKIELISEKIEAFFVIWLPTGDQLDEEIVKICKKKNDFQSYDISYDWDTVTIQYFNDVYDLVEIEHPNSLIAKIKLLKQLLSKE